MRLVIYKKIEVPVRYLELEVAVRFEEEDMPNDAPLRIGDLWKAVIDLETGVIQDWPQGKTLSFDMKVCDQGTYILRDAEMKEVERIEEDYVPGNLLPEGGDYLTLKIDETGKITNWLKHPTLEDFQESPSF